MENRGLFKMKIYKLTKPYFDKFLHNNTHNNTHMPKIINASFRLKYYDYQFLPNIRDQIFIYMELLYNNRH